MSPATSRESLRQGSALSFSLSISRMKFLEDFNMDSSPEADMEDSGAMEGKGQVKAVPFLGMLTPPTTCKYIPQTSNLLSCIRQQAQGCVCGF